MTTNNNLNKTKIITIMGREFEITKPADIYAEMQKSENNGEHVSDWAWIHAKYIGKEISTGKEMWLPYNYKQCLTEMIERENRAKNMKIENIIEENKDSYYCTVFTGPEEDLVYHCPMFPTDLHPNTSAYNEIMGTGYWSYLKNRIARRYEIDTDFGESHNKKRIKIYI